MEYCFSLSLLRGFFSQTQSPDRLLVAMIYLIAKFGLLQNINNDAASVLLCSYLLFCAYLSMFSRQNLVAAHSGGW